MLPRSLTGWQCDSKFPQGTLLSWGEARGLLTSLPPTHSRTVSRSVQRDINPQQDASCCRYFGRFVLRAPGSQDRQVWRALGTCRVPGTSMPTVMEALL